MNNTKYVLGFDPSLEAAGWAILDMETQTIVSCGLVRLEKKDIVLQSVSKWAKVGMMMSRLAGELPKDAISQAVCEAQRVFYGPAAGSLIPLGWICGYVASLVESRSTEEFTLTIADPTVWTSTASKEERLAVLEKRYGSHLEWPWRGPIPPKSIRHNGIDAVGMAYWALTGVNYKTEARGLPTV